MFGDNQSVITSSTIPHSQLSKRWNGLSYHRIREAVAAGLLRFHFIHSKQNPSDILTKPLDYASAWPHIDTLLFRRGDTLPKSDPPHDQRGVSSACLGANLPVPSDLDHLEPPEHFSMVAELPVDP